MNNHNYHGNDEPKECPVCFSAVTEGKCDNKECKGEDDE